MQVQRERAIPAGHDIPAERFVEHRGLIAVAIGGACAQACLLTVVAPGARALAPQITAIPPLAVFYDLRWLFGYNRSWSGFALTCVALVLARAAVSTLLARLAWPRELPRPGWGTTFGRFVIFTMVASVLLSPVVTLLFGVALLPFSWPFLAAVPAMLLILISLAHGGLLGSWWRTLPPVRAVGWLLASFVVLSLAAAAIASLPTVAAVAVTGLAGLVNARAWYGAVVAVTRQGAPVSSAWRHDPRWRRAARALPAPLSPLAATVALALLIGVTRLVFALDGTTPIPGGPAAIPTRAAVLEASPAPPGSGGGASGRLTSAVLVIPGFGSSCCYPSQSRKLIGPAALVRPFSYVGLDSQGRPLPYGNDATDLPLPVLGDRIAQQVWRLHEETGRPVDIVAESEGTLGVYAMLARHPGVPVGSVVLLSPIVDPGQAIQAGQLGGTGQYGDPVSGDALSELVNLAGSLSPFGESGAGRLIDSVRSDGAAYAAAAARNGQRIRWLAVIPLADAVTLPVCGLPANAIVVPALHGSLLGDLAVVQMAHRFLTDQPVAGQQQLRDTAQAIAAIAAAWRMPAIGATGPACTK
jgi:hypothetical protein